MLQRPASAVDRMSQVRGHTAVGLKQDVTVRVFAPAPGSPAGWGSLEIDGHLYPFESAAEAIAMLDEYLRRALERASALELEPATA